MHFLPFMWIFLKILEGGKTWQSKIGTLRNDNFEIPLNLDQSAKMFSLIRHFLPTTKIDKYLLYNAEIDSHCIDLVQLLNKWKWYS